MRNAALQFAIAWIGWVSLAIAQTGGQAPSGDNAATSAQSAGGGSRTAVAAPFKTGERLREGTRLVDVAGTFTSGGADSVTFTPEKGKDSYKLLQNLALERISRALEEQRGPGKWVVSGQITEFRSINFLLVTKFQWQGGETAAERP